MMQENGDDVILPIESNETTPLPRSLRNAVDSALNEERHKQNAYSSTKSIGQNFLDIGIITLHIQYLVSLFANDGGLSGFGITLLVLISIALASQILIFVFVSALYKTSGEKVTKNCSATVLNNFVTILTAISLILNIAIAIIAGKLSLNSL
jgi:hypothetical protein